MRRYIRSRMRFSLATLLLLVFWIGAGMGVWAWREPWQKMNDETLPDPFKVRADEVFPKLSDFSPDGTRIFAHSAFSNAIIADKASPGYPVIYTFPIDSGDSYGFIDDDTILRNNFILAEWHKPSEAINSRHYKFVLYHRRFPEWWWGQFFRPEVWLFAALSILLAWRFFNAHRKVRRAGDASAP